MSQNVFQCATKHNANGTFINERLENSIEHYKYLFERVTNIQRSFAITQHAETLLELKSLIASIDWRHDPLGQLASDPLRLGVVRMWLSIFTWG